MRGCKRAGSNRGDRRSHLTPLLGCPAAEPPGAEHGVVPQLAAEAVRNNSREARDYWSLLPSFVCDVHPLPVSENICSPLEVYSTHGDHSSARISTPPPPPPPPPLRLGAVPRLGSKRIRAGRSWKCAAGGRSIKLLSGGENKPACGKTTQLRGPPRAERLSQRQASWVNAITPTVTPSPRPTAWTERERRSYFSWDPARLA